METSRSKCFPIIVKAQNVANSDFFCAKQVCYDHVDIIFCAMFKTVLLAQKRNRKLLHSLEN